MAKVQLGPVLSVIAGVLGLAVIAAVTSLTLAGWVCGIGYLVVSNALLGRGLRRRGATRFGPANAATATRSTLVGVATALVVTSLAEPIPVPLLIGIVVPALALDAVDGWLARRTHSATELGARFDMEVDAYLILLLSVYVAVALGPWVLAIGLMRYAYVVAGWMLPWLRVPVPARYWRKVVAAIQGIALTAAASGLFAPWVSTTLVAVALALLVESFGRDVLWQFATRSRRSSARAGHGLS